MKILCQSFRTSFFLSFFLSVFLYFQVYVFLSLSPSLRVLPIFSRIPSGLDPLRCRVVIILIISDLDPDTNTVHAMSRTCSLYLETECTLVGDEGSCRAKW